MTKYCKIDMLRGPWLQVGGLGDVVTGLARACLERGHHVQVIMPFYECLDQKQVRAGRHHEPP